MVQQTAVATEHPAHRDSSFAHPAVCVITLQQSLCDKMVAVRSPRGHRTITARSLFGNCAVTVWSQYGIARSTCGGRTITARSPCGHRAVTVQSPYGHRTVTLRTFTNVHAVCENTRLVHSLVLGFLNVFTTPKDMLMEGRWLIMPVLRSLLVWAIA